MSIKFYRGWMIDRIHTSHPCEEFALQARIPNDVEGDDTTEFAIYEHSLEGLEMKVDKHMEKLNQKVMG